MGESTPAPLAGLRAVTTTATPLSAIPAPLAAVSHRRQPCFARAAAWSPDGGSHVLLQRDDHSVCVYRVGQRGSAGALCFAPAAELASPSPLLTAQWYPFAYAGPADEASWMLLVSARDTPLRLIAASSGDTRYAYALPSHTETLLAAYSAVIAPAPPAVAQIHPDAFPGPLALLYAGLDNATLALIDVTSPTPCAAARVSLGMRAGHAALQRIRAQAPSSARASRSIGQRGIVTCLTLVPPGLDDESPELLAVGTSDGSIGLYDTAALSVLANIGRVQPWDPQRPQQIESLGLNACVAGWRAGLSLGLPCAAAGASVASASVQPETPEAVSQIVSLPASPYLLGVAQRRHPGRILVYDLRYVPRHAAPAVAAFPSVSGPAYASRVRAMVQDGSLDFESRAPAAALLAVLSPPDASEQSSGPTNQRIMFSVDKQGAWLASGAYEDGAVHFWDIREDSLLDRSQGVVRHPTVSFRAHNDVVSSCAFHPFYPMLLTTSGSRHFVDDSSGSESDRNDEGESECEREHQEDNESTAQVGPAPSMRAAAAQHISASAPPSTGSFNSDVSLRASTSTSACASSDSDSDSDSDSVSVSDAVTASSLELSLPAPSTDRCRKSKVFSRDATAKLWDLR